VSSTLYTIGTALRRAHDSDVQVHVLVEGQWLRGAVAAVDGHGVILELDEHEHSVVRLESIAAVRVRGKLPTPAEDAPHEPANRPEPDVLAVVR
jgi:sRNA-binding regulator protein Hfq